MNRTFVVELINLSLPLPPRVRSAGRPSLPPESQFVNMMLVFSVTIYGKKKLSDDRILTADSALLLRFLGKRQCWAETPGCFFGTIPRVILRNQCRNVCVGNEFSRRFQGGIIGGWEAAAAFAVSPLLFQCRNHIWILSMCTYFLFPPFDVIRCHEKKRCFSSLFLSLSLSLLLLRRGNKKILSSLPNPTNYDLSPLTTTCRH